MKNAFEVMGLDANFEIVALLRFINLQWTRKYYESGTFSIQIPKFQYDPAIKYIYTKDREEVGEITQINYIINDGYELLALSGHFLEEELNRRIVYGNGNAGNITNAPSWINQSGVAEDVAHEFFDAFKDVKYTRNGQSVNSLLGIKSTDSLHRGKQSEHERNFEYLGDKIHDILRPSLMSYKVIYNYSTNEKIFKTVLGRDLTAENNEGNNPVVFSTRYGNIKNPNIVISTTDYKNCYIANNSYSKDNSEVTNIEAGSSRKESDLADYYLSVAASVTRTDYPSEAQYVEAMHSRGKEEVAKKPETMSFDFSIIEGSYEYRVDFDLGDKVSLVINELDINREGVLIQCAEVMKNGEWTLSMEFDIQEVN